MSTIETEIYKTSGTKSTIINSYNEKFEIYTDYSKYSNEPETKGLSNAPTPWHTFLSTIASCQIVHIRNYCIENNINYEGIKLRLDVDYNNEWIINNININIKFPFSLTTKDCEDVISAARNCPVVKNLCTNNPIVNYSFFSKEKSFD